MSSPLEYLDRAISPAEGALANTLSLVVLTALSLVTFGYQHALEPLYGSAPTQWHLNKIVWLSCIVGSFAPTLPMLPTLFVGGVLLTAMPYTSYWVAVYTGRMGNAIWGPIATHLVVLAPILYLGLTIIKGLQRRPKQNGITASAPYQTITVPICRMGIMSPQEIWLLIPWLNQRDDAQIFRFVGGSAMTFYVLWPFIRSLGPKTTASTVHLSHSSHSTPEKRHNKGIRETEIPPKKASLGQQAQSPASIRSYWRILLLPIIPALAPIFQPPILPKPLTEPFTHSTAPIRILSSVRSEYSGVVLVGEALPPTIEAARTGSVSEPHSLRYLRAGHSLLGGVWIGDRVYRRDGLGPLSFDQSGAPIGDSIYGAFVLQEAARLAHTSNGRPRKDALIIGLGTGIASTAFVQHNLSTTIVEIDSAVFEAAQRYFGLAVPDSSRLFLEDARQWVGSRRMQLEHSGQDLTSPLFDIVVHDCFSGGGVPGHIFTVEFWRDLKTTMRDDGIVAVNFAGNMGSKSSRAIVLTLMEVFAQCRAFHDSMEPLSEEKLGSEFINWVFFCTPSAEPLTFRHSIDADYLNSFLRERVLSTLPNREVAIERIAGQEVSRKEKQDYILTDERNPLVEWQQEDALHHWELMRQVLPDVFWETY